MLQIPKLSPPWWLKSPHLQTLWPKFVRLRPQLALTRERLELVDGDFIDLAWVTESSGPIVLMIHGLEGNLRSHYALPILNILACAGFQPVFMFLRGCSGEPNRLPRTYHSGSVEDLAEVLALLRKSGRPVAGAIGFSLGANLLLRYLGMNGKGADLTAAMAVSVPFVLGDASRRLDDGFSLLYRNYLMHSLKRTYINKCAALGVPMEVDLKRIRTMHEYDVDLMPGDPLSEIAKVYEVLVPEADVKLYSHLADVLEERGLARSVPDTPVAKTPAAETPTAESGPSVPVQQFTTRHGQQRWQVTPIPGEPRINAGGVRVREVVMRDGRRVEVDAGIADEVSRLDQGGYRPHQSHGFPDDHPKSHPTQKMGVEPYVEFVIGELDTVSKLRQAKLFDIKDAAAKTEVGYEYGKAVVNGKEVRTIIVRGQGLREFVNELLGAERRPPKAEGPLPPADEGGAGARPPADPCSALRFLPRGYGRPDRRRARRATRASPAGSG